MTDADFLNSDIPVLVDFYADWCGPCQMAGPVLEKIAADYKGKIKLVKINVDENQALAQKYGVASIPTVILFKEGKEKERVMGYQGDEGYRNLILKNLKIKN
ncbi:MAG: thioredoxin [Candidatus Shapirobacteria bacterium]